MRQPRIRSRASIGSSKRTVRTRYGYPTSPTSRPGPASSTSPSSSTPSRGALSAGASPARLTPASCWMRWSRRCMSDGLFAAAASSTTAIAVCRADSSARRNTLYRGIAMYTRKRRSDRSGRPPLWSPGRPPTAGRDQRLRFWGAITAGMASEDAAIEAGISPAVGTRWFREAGGIPPSRFGPSAKPISGRYLSLTEREEIALLRVRGYSIREVGRCLGRAASTISRELRRNAATRSGRLKYRATTAQCHADQAARRPKRAKLALNVALRTYVEERLAGVVVAPSGGL